jgi:hypothetical protein
MEMRHINNQDMAQVKRAPYSLLCVGTTVHKRAQCEAEMLPVGNVNQQVSPVLAANCQGSDATCAAMVAGMATS